MMDGFVKESEAVAYNSVTRDNTNDRIYLVKMKKNSQKSDDKILQVRENNNIHHEEIQADSVSTQSENIEIKMAIDETKKKNNKKSNRGRQLSTHNKKENLKKGQTYYGKVTKPRATRKSNKIAESAISSNVICKETGDKEYFKESSLSTSACSTNDNNNTLTMFNNNIPHYIAMPEESRPYNLDSMNGLQYMEDNNLRHANQQMIFMNSNWLIVPENNQNFALNTITNMQNKVEQSSFMNDRQYTYTTGDYNWKQNENPYSYSSINSIDPYKMFSGENKSYCFCNACVHSKPNNTYVGIQNFPKVTATFQQVTNNSTTSYIPPAAATSNYLSNPTIRPYNNIYQTPQTEYNLKTLFYRNANVMNYVYSNGCDAISVAKEQAVSPLNNWYINGLTTPYNNNLNIPYSPPIASDILATSSLYVGAANAHLNNKEIEGNISMNQYGGRDNLNPYAMSSLETQQFALTAQNVNSNEFMNNLPLSQASTETNDSDMILPDSTNYLSETSTADVPNKPLSCVSAKKRDWVSNMINTIDKDNF